MTASSATSPTVWPFIGAAFVIVAALIEAALPSRRATWARVPLLALCTLALFGLSATLVGTPLAPVLTGRPWQHVAEQVIAAIWWLLAARLLVAVSRLAFTRKARPRESRILLDLLAGVIYVGTGLAIAAFVYGIEVRGLLATSGVIAVVLGLALQSTLGDLFSGIAVGVERPYRVGDHLSLDGGADGIVTQINWRSTHLRHGHDIVVLPNSMVAKARLVNHSAPTPVSALSVEVRIHPDVPPTQVLPVLQAALLGCEGHARGETATARCTGLSGDGAVYTLTLACPQVDAMSALRSEVLCQVHRHLLHAGIPLAIGGVSPASGWRARLLPPEEVLGQSELFARVSPEGLAVLAAQLRPVELQAGDVLFRQGGAPDAMYMITAGTIEVTFDRESGSGRRHLLTPGESVGLVGLVTGQPYRSTALALNTVRALRLDGDGLAAALELMPQLAPELDDAVERALAIILRLEPGEDDAERQQPGALLRRWRSFLHAIHTRAPAREPSS